MENKNTISQADIDNMISKSQIRVQTVFGKCTIMSVQLPNGFVIVESSACVDPITYSEAMGASICMSKIKDRLWELEGYKLQNMIGGN